MTRHLIVGCGITGAVLAERIARELKEEVVIIDKRKTIGGNCYDYFKDNICIHKYGAHIFHTDNRDVWNYLGRFTNWHPYMHEVKAIVDGIEIPVPFNLNSLHLVFPKNMANSLENKLIEKFGYGKKISILELKKTNDKELEYLSNYIYNRVFLGYTLKQWETTPEELDPSITARVPIYISKDNRYFQNKYQGIPLNGYTEMIKNILKNKLISIGLNTDFRSFKNKEGFDKIWYTGAIDEYFNYEYGELSYRSLRFDFRTVKTKYYQNNSVINYPENYDFTRIAEYKYFLNNKSNRTIISFEYPEKYNGSNERYYPILNEENNRLYHKYLEKAKNIKNLTFLGRLGDYKYYDMDKAVERVLQLKLK